ncbi:transmembrane protein 236-like [Sinocyclocheilus anshuiensis]|uniref:transmembrane protein 236-like n=1 Tax=Sinocyclocheilus anshuiensis TaxID=1608454 RepID=UPI0007B8C0C7|nr:PREDICTED: transmembrane protein 236-like [Sinocyclocheilus anshuiensis]
MLSGKTVKLILYELLQFACLCIPVFAVMERFASVIRFVKSSATAYWLVVAASVAYVASVTLFVWVPLKYFILRTQRFSEVTNWRPVTLAYVILSTLPCFAIIIASSKVQADAGVKNDPFTELPVSLVLFSLICVDIVEKIRPLCLTGQARGLGLDFEMPGPVLTHSEQVTSVSRQLQANGRDGGASPRSPVRNGTISGHWRDADEEGTTRTSNTAYLYTSHSYSGPFRFVWIREPRHDLFVATFLFWFDTVEMVRVAGTDSVYYSAWVFPIYILAFLSFLRVVITPDSPLLASSSVLTQDLPFLVMRICLVAVFGYVTPVLYILKNIFTVVSFMYFVFMTKLKLLNRESMF